MYSTDLTRKRAGFFVPARAMAPATGGGFEVDTQFPGKMPDFPVLRLVPLNHRSGAWLCTAMGSPVFISSSSACRGINLKTALWVASFGVGPVVGGGTAAAGAGAVYAGCAGGCWGAAVIYTPMREKRDNSSQRHTGSTICSSPCRPHQIQITSVCRTGETEVLYYLCHCSKFNLSSHRI